MGHSHVKYEDHSLLPFLSYNVYILTSCDPKCHLTSTTKNSNHLLNTGHPHIKYDEIPHYYPSWGIMLTRFWSSDLLWPHLNFDFHQNRGNLLNMGHLHGKYEVSQSYPSCLQANVKIFTVWPLLTPNDCLSISIKTSHSYSFWDLFTSVTYMHTHTTLPLHRFILSPAWTQTHTHTHLTTCIHTHTYKMTVALMNSSRSVT